MIMSPLRIRRRAVPLAVTIAAAATAAASALALGSSATTVKGLSLTAAATQSSTLPAADYRLKVSRYNAVIRKLDAVMKPRSFSSVLGSANRTGRACAPHATSRLAAFCWQSGDNTTKDWTPQGITTSADAYANGLYSSTKVILTSWYYSGAGTSKGVRVSFINYAKPSAPVYRHVLLVQPYMNSAGKPDFKPVNIHAGGLAWYGYYLYVPDTSHGFRVFDMRHLWKVSTGTGIGRQSNGSYQAFNYAYVLPQALSVTASTTGGQAALRFSAASVDRTSTPDSMIVPEYSSAGTGTRVVRFPLDYSTRLLKASSDGYVHASQAYRVNIPSMQGATAINGKFYVSASAGSSHYGSLWTFKGSATPVKHSSVFPVGNEDLSYWAGKNQLWTLSEYAGRRYVVAIKASAF